MTSRVSESEIRVMEVLWQTSPLTASEVIDKLDDTRWNEKTVKTFLNRLLKKNAIGFKKDGRKYAYFPLIEREQLLKQESAGFLEIRIGMCEAGSGHEEASGESGKGWEKRELHPLPLGLKSARFK